jgi:uncharacterized protein
VQEEAGRKLDYQFNATKNAQNLSKHGIDFADAIAIFDGPVLETVDKRRDYGEERITVIGIAEGIELFVVYTMRGQNRHLISARRANKREREKYHQALARRPDQG